MDLDTLRRFTGLAATLATLVLAATTAAAPLRGTGAAAPPPLFVSFVTSYDSDGSGPATPNVCEHMVLAGIETPIDILPGQPLDVTTPGCKGLPDLAVALRVPLSPTDPNVVDTKRPTIRIVKQVGAPAMLPVKVEALTPDEENPARRQSFGYSALSSTAPQSFVAAFNLHEQDGDAATTDTHVEVTLAGPPSSLAVVTENFVPGATLAVRTDSRLRRLQSGRSSAGTQVPTSIGIDVYAGNAEQQLILSRNQATVLDFLSLEPGSPTVTGTIDRLPASVNLTLRTRDSDGDRQKERTLDLVASDRTASLAVIAESVTPFFKRARRIELRLADVPRRVRAALAGSHVEVDVRTGAIGSLRWRAEPGPKPTFDRCRVVRCEDGVSVRDVSNKRFSATGLIHRLRQANITLTADELDALVDTAPETVTPEPCDPIEPGCDPTPDPKSVYRTPLNVDMELDRKGGGIQRLSATLSRLLPSARIHRFKDGRTSRIEYSDKATGSGSGPTITLDGTNLSGLPAGKNGIRAKNLHVRLVNVSRVVRFSHGEEGFPLSLTASGPEDTVISGLEVQLTSGPDDRLASSECIDDPCSRQRRLDGILLRDLEDRFVVFARLSGVQHAFVAKSSFDPVDHLLANLEANASGDPTRAFRADMKRWFRDPPPEHTESVFATLDGMPRKLRLDSASREDGLTLLTYTASAESPTLKRRKAVVYPSAPQLYRYSDLQLTPLPTELRICRENNTNFCARDVFSRTDADGGSLLLQADRRFRFDYFDSPAAGSVAYTNVDLTLKRLVLQNDGTDAGYLAIDTGWDAEGAGTLLEPHFAPPSDARVEGGIKIVNNTRVITDFKFPNGFGAERRMLTWPGPIRLKLGEGLARRGHTYCPRGTSFDLKRVAEGLDVHLNLAGGFCKAYVGGIRPGSDVQSR